MVTGDRGDQRAPRARALSLRQLECAGVGVEQTQAPGAVVVLVREARRVVPEAVRVELRRLRLELFCELSDVMQAEEVANQWDRLITRETQQTTHARTESAVLRQQNLADSGHIQAVKRGRMPARTVRASGASLAPEPEDIDTAQIGTSHAETVFAVAMTTFVAIDFETATTRRDSACAVGLAACCGGRIVLSRIYLIRPPAARFTFTGLHGLDWDDVRDAPTFAELWPTLRAWIDDAAFVAAHNAAFDRSVLRACCARYRLRAPRTRFVCTVDIARAQWDIRPTKLPDVCRRLRIPLRHHDAGADAVACARIVLAAEAEGWRPGSRRTRRTKTRAIVCTARPAAGRQWTHRLGWIPFQRLLYTWWRRVRPAITARLRRD